MYDPLARADRSNMAILKCNRCLKEYHRKLSFFKKVVRYFKHKVKPYYYLECEGCATYFDL